MFQNLDTLDDLGLFQKADAEQKKILQAVNFMLTKKRPNPNMQIQTKLDAINSQINNVQDMLENSDSGGSDTVVTLDNQEVEFKNDK